MSNTEQSPRRPIRRRWSPRRRHREPGRPRLRKLRLLLIVAGLGALALVSTVFGMMMAVASDLPQLENRAEYRTAANSFLYDDHWRPIGLFAPPNNVVIDTPDEVSQSMKDAIVAVEDRRFWTSSGVDFRGIARAFLADLSGRSRQGGSTIPQQFVKNALAEQDNRTIFEKLREAALAYHLTRKWSKQKILAEYLNSIYFGNGAYGVESAARVYFGKLHGFDSQAQISSDGSTSSPGCGDSSPRQPRPKCASVLAPWEAALLAGMVASPAQFNPIAHPLAARERRNLVLRDMLQEGYITRAQYLRGVAMPLPTQADLQQPAEPTAAPYFTSWLRPQILAAVGRGLPPSVAEYRAYFGGLKIRTTLDLELQRAAEQAVSQELPSGSGLPSASLVAIDNHTGQVRAMIGGPIVNGAEDYKDDPFNLATEGYRQPGSAFKLFTLALALKSGAYSPSSIVDSAPQNFVVPGTRGREHFVVHNFDNVYVGPTTLTQATVDSDNSVYAQVGIRLGTRHIAALAHAMGIRSPLSTNYAMILGGLRQGVSPLDLAHAYSTMANGGVKAFDPVLGAPDGGPTGIAQIQCSARVCGGDGEDLLDHPTLERILPSQVASAVQQVLSGVVQHGTGTAAAIGGVMVAGKTGTTSNYVDAWFVGWTPQLTTAIWVGYPNKLVQMNTQYNGRPVEGGTYPAIIWHNFMTQALQVLAGEEPAKKAVTETTGSSGAISPLAAPSSTSSPGGQSATSSGAGAGTAASPTSAGGAGGTAGTTGNGAAGGTAGGGTAGGGTAGGGTAGGGTAGGGTAGGGTAGGGGTRSGGGTSTGGAGGTSSGGGTGGTGGTSTSGGTSGGGGTGGTPAGGGAAPGGAGG